MKRETWKVNGLCRRVMASSVVCQYIRTCTLRAEFPRLQQGHVQSEPWNFHSDPHMLMKIYGSGPKAGLGVLKNSTFSHVRPWWVRGRRRIPTIKSNAHELADRRVAVSRSRTLGPGPWPCPRGVCAMDSTARDRKTRSSGSSAWHLRYPNLCKF